MEDIEELSRLLAKSVLSRQGNIKQNFTYNSNNISKTKKGNAACISTLISHGTLIYIKDFREYSKERGEKCTYWPIVCTKP